MAKHDSFFTGMVCLSGHPITDRLEDLTALASTSCALCGEPTTTQCPHCDASIRGDYVPPRGCRHVLKTWRPPAYCHNCGSAYPWTQQALDAAREVVDQDDLLQPDDKKSLKESLDALTRDTPGSPGALLKFKRISMKMREEGVSALRTIMLTVVTEYVRQQIRS